MHYDPHWDSDFLQERARELAKSEYRLRQSFNPATMTEADARNYHWWCELHRCAANRTFSKSYWEFLKQKRQRS